MSIMEPPLSPISSPQWTFTQGLILGQASVILLGLLFVRYVVFSPSEPLDQEEWKTNRAAKAKKAVLSTAPVPPPVPSQILKKTGYDMSTHPPESTDWVNVLFAQVLQGYRNDLLLAGGEEGARQRVEKWLNPEGGKLSWLDPIEVTGLSLGTSYPLLSDARIRPSDGSGHIRAEIDIDYLDSVSLSLQTSVLINFPRPRFAVLPVSLGVELVSLGGTLSLELHEPMNLRQHLHSCLLPDFHLNLKTTTLLGSRAKLQDIPKLEQLIVSRLRSILQDRLVHPRHLSLALPSLLSPSISPTPIINDIGEGAITAMGDSIKQGFDRMVNDFSGAFDSVDIVGSPSVMGSGESRNGGGIGSTVPASSVAPSSSLSGMPRGSGLATQQQQQQQQQQQGRNPQLHVNPTSNDNGSTSTGAAPLSPRLARKIPMPAGFPGLSATGAGANGYSEDSATPIQTPGVGGNTASPAIRRHNTGAAPSSEINGNGSGNGNGNGSTSRVNGDINGTYGLPGQQTTASTSAYQYRPRIPPSSRTNTNQSSYHQSSSQSQKPPQSISAQTNGSSSQFKFTGPFAAQGQPGTPGAAAVPAGTAERRMGALNSRAA